MILADAPRSKPGKHGTLHLYAVPYRDDCDRDNTGTQYVYAYDADGAFERVHDPDLGWIAGDPRRVR